MKRLLEWLCNFWSDIKSSKEDLEDLHEDIEQISKRERDEKE